MATTKRQTPSPIPSILESDRHNAIDRARRQMECPHDEQFTVHRLRPESNAAPWCVCAGCGAVIEWEEMRRWAREGRVRREQLVDT